MAARHAAKRVPRNRAEASQAESIREAELAQFAREAKFATQQTKRIEQRTLKKRSHKTCGEAENR